MRLQILVVNAIANFLLMFIGDGALVQAERDGSNNPSELEAPPVMHAELVKLRPATFINQVIDPFRVHLKKHWSDEDIERAEIKHRELIVVYACEPAVKSALDSHDEKTFFNQA